MAYFHLLYFIADWTYRLRTLPLSFLEICAGFKEYCQRPGLRRHNCWWRGCFGRGLCCSLRDCGCLRRGDCGFPRQEGYGCSRRLLAEGLRLLLAGLLLLTAGLLLLAAGLRLLTAGLRLLLTAGLRLLLTAGLRLLLTAGLERILWLTLTIQPDKSARPVNINCQTLYLPM